ncbi:hypothetical protein [Oceanobacillus kimchii]|uniref:hypothetical protein n=1 Tax=Oceanobacillus kimchii TaxID=746691 RepID=UPI00034BCD1B|nr:hypothetical protein [Oceanobacillus kimchii]
MKAKVIKKFKDKETKKLYKPGVYYEGSKQRIKEIADAGYLEVKDESKGKK